MQTETPPPTPNPEPETLNLEPAAEPPYTPLLTLADEDAGQKTIAAETVSGAERAVTLYAVPWRKQQVLMQSFLRTGDIEPLLAACLRCDIKDLETRLPRLSAQGRDDVQRCAMEWVMGAPLVGKMASQAMALSRRLASRISALSTSSSAPAVPAPPTPADGASKSSS